MRSFCVLRRGRVGQSVLRDAPRHVLTAGFLELLGADIIQTMRVRKQHSGEEELIDAAEELRARQTLHGLDAEQVEELLLGAFKEFDADGSGKLESKEMRACLESLTLGNTKLTEREIKMIMNYVSRRAPRAIALFPPASTNLDPRTPTPPPPAPPFPPRRSMRTHRGRSSIKSLLH